MKLLNDINVVASKEFIELMALKTEAQGKSYRRFKKAWRRKHDNHT